VWIKAHVGARSGFGEVALDSRAVTRGCAVLWYRDGVWSDERAAGAAREDRRLVVLIHGLDEPGGIWEELAPAL